MDKEKEIKPEEKVENKVEDETREKDKKSMRHKLDAKDAEIEKWKADANHWKNEYYRAFADTKNLRNRLEKDQSRAIKYRAEGFIEALLPILDSFYLALQNEPTDPALKNYLTGFQYIYRNLVSVLQSEGVSEIAPKVGDKFDPMTMNAMDVVESEKDANCVAKVYAQGYKLHDLIIRHAMVTVTAKPKAKEEKPETEKPTENKFDA